MALSNRAIVEALGVSHTIDNREVKNGRIDRSKPIDQIRIDWERNAVSCSAPALVTQTI